MGRRNAKAFIATEALVICDKKQDINALLGNLKKAVNVLKTLSSKEFEFFRNWFTNIIMQGIEPESRESLNKIIK